MSSFSELELSVIRWAEARRIIPNSTAVAQWHKACEEMEELGQALDYDELSAIKDGVGDVVVCLINLCALKDIDLVSCLELAYNEIKDRKGYMNADGIFVKEGGSAPAIPAKEQAQPKADAINPDHYKTGGIETIDYMQAKSTAEEFAGHLRLTALKYLSRAGHKDDVIQEFKKAQWYLNRLVNFMESR